MSVVKISKDNFDEIVMKNEKPVLLDFWATWCGPCQMISPVVDQIAEENPDIVVGKVNVDEELELAQSFRVVSIPTLVLIKGGEVVGQVVGALPKEKILEMMEK